MRFVGLVLFLTCLWRPIPGIAQNTAEIDKIADTMVRLCVGGGHTEATSGTGSGGADLSLRSLDVTGNLKGEFKIEKTNAEGLVKGLDSALSKVAADQADKVRECLKPVRDRLLDIMLPMQKQGSAGQTVTAPGGIVTQGQSGNNFIVTAPQPVFSRPPQNILIDAQCEAKLLTTTTLAPEETIKLLGLWPTPIANGGEGLQETSITGSEKYVWPKPAEGSFPILNGYKCKITNYTDAPIFDVWIELREVFIECIRDQTSPNQMHMGRITLRRGWRINIKKIDVGIANAFVFYTYNGSDKVVILSIPDAMTVTMPNNTVQSVRLVHSGPMQLWPQLKLPVPKS